MHWYVDVLKKYAVFDGRATRSEYWYFALFNAIIYIVLAIVGAAIGGAAQALFVIYLLAVFLPSLGVSIRRLHDIGKSGWWILIAIIPLIGDIVLLVFACTDSSPGTNQYGPSPKAVLAPA